MRWVRIDVPPAVKFFVACLRPCFGGKSLSSGHDTRNQSFAANTDTSEGSIAATNGQASDNAAAGGGRKSRSASQGKASSGQGKAAPVQGKDRDMGTALRNVYQQTIDEQIPGEMLDLLGKLD
jgi:hypothetical protein